MPDRDDDHTPGGPQSRGSPQALAVLRAIHEWNCPCLRSDICVLAGLDEADAMLALRGLRERGLVQCDSRGTAARWSLTRWAKEAGRVPA